MPIKPNIQIYQTTAASIQTLETKDLILLPDDNVSQFINLELIDKIRNQPLPNDIATVSASSQRPNIARLVRLLGQFCKSSSTNEIIRVVSEIHEILNPLEVHIIKNWVRLLTGLHPKVDEYIKVNLPYFKNPHSEYIGTNTITFYADESAIDIWFWSETPVIQDSKVSFFLEPYNAPHSINESTRQKLPDSVVAYMQEANQLTNKKYRNAIIYDAFITTADITGKEELQKRPIPYNVAHGVCLNNDWYHQSFRILGGEKAKFWAKHDAIYKLYEPHPNGYFVHLLFNYITPLTPRIKAEQKAYKWRFPMGVEETFPTYKNGLQMDSLANGQRILPVAESVNDESLEPEIIRTKG